MKRSILLSVVLIMVMGIAVASDTPTEGIWNFKNYTARTAKSRYDFEVGKAKRVYDIAVERLLLARVGTMQKARKGLLSKLKEALSVETKAGRLDEAIRIKKAIEEIKGGKGIPEKKQPKSSNKQIPSCAVKYNGHHYLAVLRPAISWKEAKKLCENMGGYLVCVRDEKESTFIRKLTQGSYVWIGGILVNKKWKWINNENVSDKLWVLGSKNTKEYPAYLIMGKRGYFPGIYNKDFDKLVGFVCEFNSKN